MRANQGRKSTAKMSTTPILTYIFPWWIYLFLCGLLIPNSTLAQKTEEIDKSYQPLVLKLDESGEKFVRFVMWHQFWLTSNNLAADQGNFQIDPSIRRSRFLAYARISPDFMMLTHFGVNSLTSESLSAVGNDGDGAQLFLHGAWGEFRLSDRLYLGAGLHYWRGLSRLASQSTVSFMTLDQSRPFTSWHSLGISDQYARHLGVYAKGELGRLDYRLAVNSPIRNPMDGGKDYGMKDSGLLYTGVSHRDTEGNATGNMLLEGYFRFNFWDLETTELPYHKGTYLGEKSVLAVGAGFFLHPDAMYRPGNGGHLTARHFALDGFLDIPVHKGALHAYAAFTHFDYGRNYVSRWAGTGISWYGQAGYFMQAVKLMPYIAFNYCDFQGLEDPINTLDVGLNYFVHGQHAKLTVEYHRIQGDIREVAIATQEGVLSQVRLQMQVFL